MPRVPAWPAGESSAQKDEVHRVPRISASQALRLPYTLGAILVSVSPLGLWAGIFRFSHLGLWELESTLGPGGTGPLGGSPEPQQGSLWRRMELWPCPAMGRGILLPRPCASPAPVCPAASSPPSTLSKESFLPGYCQPGWCPCISFLVWCPDHQIIFPLWWNQRGTLWNGTGKGLGNCAFSHSLSVSGWWLHSARVASRATAFY